MASKTQDSPALRPADAALLALLRRALFASDEVSGAVDEATDWAAVFREARQQAVLPLALEAALTLPQKLQPPKEAVEGLRRKLRQQAVKNETLMAAQDEILRSFSREDLPCAVLKGSSASANYPKPELRVLGDIDILIDPVDVERAAVAVQSLGYQPLGSHVGYELRFKGTPGVVELHSRIADYPPGPAGEALRALMAGALGDLREESIEPYRFPVLSLERQAVLLLLHIQLHMKSSGIGLRHLCDAAAFFSRLDPEDWPASVAPALRACGLLRFAEVMASTCVKYLGLPAQRVPWCPETEETLCHDLLTEFMSSGNFGWKDAGHRATAILSADKSGQGASLSMPLTALRNLNLYARKHYPVTRRAPILLPFFWVYLPLHYLRKAHRKGEKPAIRETLSAGRRRQKLFARLGIFEPGPTGKGDGGR